MDKWKIWLRYGMILILSLALAGCGKTDGGVSVVEEETLEGEDSGSGQQPEMVLQKVELWEDDGSNELSISNIKSWAVFYALDGKSLNDNDAGVYNALKGCIEEVARGERENTRFTLQTALTEEQLSKLNVNTIIFYLLNDCPFDLYWHDKTLSSENGKDIEGVYSKYYQDGRVEFSFKVAQAYRKSPDSLYEVNSANMDKVNHARQKAQAIVDANRDSTDYDKLVAYKNAVCDLVTYDSAALATPVYGDAYQVISVFDEDPNTNVVCEGYAKAFKYLCDLSAFDHAVNCYTVSGVSDSGQGAGEHMWNVVRIREGISDGESYIVDPTNCDAGTIGADYELFMADNPEGSVDSSYTFYCNGWAPITYTYNAEPREVFGSTILSLGNAGHTGQDSLHNKEPGSGQDVPAEPQPEPTPDPGTKPEPTPEPEPTPDPTPTPEPEPTPEPAPEPEPGQEPSAAPDSTPQTTPATDNNTEKTPEQKTDKEDKKEEEKEQTSTLSFDVAELNKTYGDGTFVETVSGELENSKITYKSSDESVAQIVNRKGKVRILKPGTVTITATDSNGGSTASYKLTVAKKPLTWDVSGLSATDQKENIGVDGGATLFGEMTIEGILEADKDKDSRFSFDGSDLTGMYASTVVGTQKVTLNWREGKKRTLNGEKAGYYELPDELPELEGEITSTQVLETPPESTDELQLELEMENSISQVPEAFLENKSLELDTPDKIQTALETKVQEWDAAIPAENIEVYDVTLRSLDIASDVEGDEGEWVDVTDERFPEEGVTVTLPYPKGTSGKMQDFVVCHMFAENMYLSSPGEVEYPEVTETEKGIQFKVYGLSPIAVGWIDGHQTVPEVLNSDDGGTPDIQAASNGQDQDARNRQASRKQGNAETVRILSYLIFMAVILVIIVGLLAVLLRKKK